MNVKGKLLTRYTSADLTYDPVTHTTVLPNGESVPHVTHVLAETGVATDWEDVMHVSRRARVHINDRRELGSVVHADLHAFDDDDLEWESLDPRSRPFMEAWAVCRENLSLMVMTHERERQVFHPSDEVTGRLDGIYLWKPGLLEKRVLIDHKIGDPRRAACRFQTAAYVAAYLAEHPNERIDARWACQLVPDATPPYLITPYPSFWRDDYADFRCFLRTYRCQQ